MRRLIMAAAGATLALAGCSSEPEPIEPTAGASPSTSATSVPAPTMPAQASEEGPEGAVAFVYFWVATFNHSAKISDASALRELGDACTPCDSYARTIDEEEGVDGDLWRISSASVDQLDGGFDVVVEVETRDESGVATESIGFEVSDAPDRSITDIYRIEA